MGAVVLNVNRTECLVICDAGNHAIRLYSIEGATVVLIAGVPEHAGWLDAAALDSMFNHPSALAVFNINSSTVLIADGYNHRIRRLDLSTMTVDTVAGSGSPGALDGPAAQAQFYYPSALATQPAPAGSVGGENMVYVSDFYSGNVRLLNLATAQETRRRRACGGTT
mmetsp:Transcript_34532/g.91145  ORF Transcript_34532/g.91145 Transcript_34532/m.91145 type:complete len:167 (+) Transcript_34532:214-714(+)